MIRFLYALPEKTGKRKTTQSVRIHWILNLQITRTDTTTGERWVQGKDSSGEPPALLLGVSPRWKLTAQQSTRPPAPSPPHSADQSSPEPREQQGPGRSLTRGARGLVLLLLLILVVALPASLGPRLPVTVRVLRLQHIDGGGAGPAAVVGKPASPAAPRALRGGLDPLGGEGRSELLRSLLQQQEQRHQSQVLQLVLAEEEGKDWVSMLVRLISICFSQAVTSNDNHLPICFPWFEDLRKINMASTNSGKTVLY